MADVNSSFSVGIGADISVLQVEMQKAENLLKQFEAAAKKATNIGEINYLNTQIGGLNKTIAQLGQEMNKAGKPIGDATQSLVNMSRIAQDAPYGFMGIANNLNPMLESFQRLSATEGGTKKALQAMASGLMGPAGVGVALGVVSSLVVAFGSDISDFFAKMTSGSKSLVETNKAFHESKDAFAKAYIEMVNLGNAFDSFHNGTMSKKAVLDEYNKSLGAVYGSTKSLDEAERIYTENSDKYIKSALYKAAAQLALKKAAEEAFKQQEAINNPKAFGSGDVGTFLLSKVTGMDLPSIGQVLASESVQKKAKEQESIFLSIAKAFNKMSEEINATAEKTVLFGKDEPKPQKVKKEFDYITAIKKRTVLVGQEELEPVGKDTAIEVEEKKRQDFLDFLSDFYKHKIDLTKKDYEANKKILEQERKDYEQFAKAISGELTNSIFSLFDALKSGQSIGDALGSIFGNLVEKLAQMVIQAALLSAIMAAFGFPMAGGGISGFGNAFNMLLGIPMSKNADGGVAVGPHLGLIGEAGPEAILPLNKLGSMMKSTFSAGAMSGAGNGNGGNQFVLRGQDLLISLNRTQKASNLKGQNISLA